MTLSEKVKTFSEFIFSESVHFAERTHTTDFFLSTAESVSQSILQKEICP